MSIETAQQSPSSDAGNPGLVLESIEVKSFRNYQHARIDDFGMLNIFIGPNASGKTSLVEAIQLMTAGKSFRTSHLADVVAWGCDKSAITCTITGNGRHLQEKLSIEQGRRSYLVNDKPRSLDAIKGTLPAVVFSPDDLELVKGSATARRSALDDIASQMSQSFRSVKRDYLRLVRQKNQALKDELSDSFIDSIDSVLAKVSAQYSAYRQHVADQIGQELGARYAALAGKNEHAHIAYSYSWEDYVPEDGSVPSDSGVDASSRTLSREEILARLAEVLPAMREKERARKKALVGAHADKVVFLLEGKNATSFASQGQQRSMVLAFKLAELDVLANRGSQQPILLLDDVMSELDQSRRQHFMQFVDERVQTFVTTTNEEYFDEQLLQKAQVYRMPLGQTLSFEGGSK